MIRASTAHRAGRRRFLRIAAVAAAGTMLPALARTEHAQLHVRHGIALGAETEIQLCHPERRTALAAIDACFVEVRRLESIFSLHQPGSALSRLNRDGRLQAPPPELVSLLRTASTFSRATGGAFDATVQPLWDLYAAHYSSAGADARGPSPTSIQQALARVDYRRLRIGDTLIAFDSPGMALTLNGIAQGYITDAIAALLRARGFSQVLVDIGEMRALGSRPDGAPWRVGIADPDRPWRPLAVLPLTDQAIATSGGYGTRFDADGRRHHLFDPRDGSSANHYRSVSVIAPDATSADALSTGLSVLAPAAARALVAGFAQTGAVFIGADGREWSTGVLPTPLSA